MACKGSLNDGYGGRRIEASHTCSSRPLIFGVGRDTHGWKRGWENAQDMLGLGTVSLHCTGPDIHIPLVDFLTRASHNAVDT